MKKAIIVGTDVKNDGLMDYYMEELENLAHARNLDVVYQITQKIQHITPNYFIGSGKVEEIKTFVTNLDADMVIFNNELSGSQIRNLEKVFDCRVIDRTLLILDIFAARAKTKEAMLQVEIAQLEYMLPRLKGLRESLGRQQGGIGSRGPGEKKLEMDRRKILSDRVRLKKELKEVLVSRQIQRKSRKKTTIPKVAIVGYTNAGKSTLLNKLLEYTNLNNNKSVKEKDMLFATLETATRKIKLENNNEFIITDTVGFVSDLPHDLVEAFKSTLEEITEADFLVHVVDASNPNYQTQINVTNDTLKELGVHDIDVIYIFNKIDLMDNTLNPPYFPNISTSLNDLSNIPQVITFLENELFKSYHEVTLFIPFKDGDVVSEINDSCNVLSQEYSDLGTKIVVKLSEIQKSLYFKYLQK
jgi:GTP-binding protein HflX